MSLTRRGFILGATAAGAAGFAREADAYTTHFSSTAMKYFAGIGTDNGYQYRLTNWKKIKDQWRRQLVQYQSTEPIGSVVVDTSNHFLYVVFENQTALRYGVGVGRDGFRWYGRARIDRKALWPRWVPPPEMRKRQPNIPDYVDGGIDNPLGPRAMYLYRDKTDLGYRLRSSPGRSARMSLPAASGCSPKTSSTSISVARSARASWSSSIWARRSSMRAPRSTCCNRRIEP